MKNLDYKEKTMPKLLSNKKLQENAKRVMAQRENFALTYGDKADLYSKMIAPLNNDTKKRSRKKAGYLGHFTNHPRLVVGKDTNRCQTLTLNPCKEYEGSGFIDQWGYCSETNVLKITIGKYKYLYFHITARDMKKAENYKQFHYFYNQEIKGKKDSLKV